MRTFNGIAGAFLLFAWAYAVVELVRIHVLTNPPVETVQVCKYVSDMWQENGRYMMSTSIDACHNVKWEGRA
jgi:hypothetical protein